jgi:hypothetical protein
LIQLENYKHWVEEHLKESAKEVCRDRLQEIFEQAKSLLEEMKFDLSPSKTSLLLNH